MLIAILWQAFAWLSPVYMDQQKEFIDHMVVHAQEMGHYHHADETLHIDGDESEPPHQHANQALQVPGLAPGMTHADGDPVPSILTPGGAGTGHASACLEGPLRPPRPPQRSAFLA